MHGGAERAGSSRHRTDTLTPERGSADVFSVTGAVHTPMVDHETFI